MDINFTYVISSANATVGQANDCYINVGGIGNEFDQFQVQCIAFNITGTNLAVDIDNYCNLVVSNFSENGYFGIGGSECILATISTNDNISQLTSGAATVFKVKNMHTVRNLRFRLFGPNLQPWALNRINNGSTTYWMITLLFTQLPLEH